MEALSRQPDRRFFHWEIEFPEVFFGFADAEQRHLKHKDEIAPGSAGFDAVVGNPPYVRQEAIKAIKEFLKASYQTFDSTNDLYVFFQEQEVRNLRVAGRMAMIVANKWMRAGYGERLRDFLARTAQPVEVIDFGHSPIFPDADTFPCILIVSRRPQPIPAKQPLPEGEVMATAAVPRDDWDGRTDLGRFVSQRRYSIPTRLLRNEGWSLEDPRVQLLLEKIRRSGPALADFSNTQPLRGILTGFNEAFVIDAFARKRLIKENKSSAEIIRPLLRGRDMDRWGVRETQVFLITIPSSENKDWPWKGRHKDAEAIFQRTYPAIYKHLMQFRQGLTKRQDQGKHWWELRSCDYMSAFAHRKLVWQEMAWFTRFSFDDGGHVLLNTGYVLDTSDPFIPACLNSHVAWWYMWRTAQHGKDEVLRLIREYTALFPIPTLSSEKQEAIETLVAALATNARQRFTIERDAVQEGSKITEANDLEERMILWLTLSKERFVSRICKAFEDVRPSGAMVKALTRFYDRANGQLSSAFTEQYDLESRLATLIEDAYELTPEERQMLRATRPVRDPLEVLRAKIDGRAPEPALADGGTAHDD